jgi:predicted Zn finger-like uncharacterized protein
MRNGSRRLNFHGFRSVNGRLLPSVPKPDGRESPMHIACPNCAISYRVEDSVIGALGRSVRCVRCKTVWFAAAPSNIPGLRDHEEAATAAATDGEQAVAAFQAELGVEAPTPPEAVPPATSDDAAPAEPPAATIEEHAPSPGGQTSAETQAIAPDAPPIPPAEPGGEPPPDTPPVALADIPIPVEDAPPLAPVDDGDGERPAPDARTIAGASEDIESVAARRRARAAERRRRSSRSRLPAAILLLIVVSAALIGWRKDIVRHVPQLASFYGSIGLAVNLRGLAFSEVKVASQAHDGVPVLVVEGKIVNVASTAMPVPRLRFSLRNAAGTEIYSWTAMPSQSAIEPGQTLPFRSRLASPPKDGHNVQLRFFTRRDAGAEKP